MNAWRENFTVMVALFRDLFWTLGSTFLANRVKAPLKYSFLCNFAKTFLIIYKISVSAGNRRKHDESMGESCAEDSVTTATQAAKAVATTAASVASNAATAASTGIKSAVQPRQAKVTNTEKTLLLSSDDEFQ